MNPGEYINELELFTPISLKGLEQAGLRRMETKFVLPLPLVPAFLSAMHTHYRVLEVNGHRRQAYTTHYFDTEGMKLYHDHHNGYARRIKVRQRRYELTGDCYFEVKHKKADNSTDKVRVSIPALTSEMAEGQHSKLHYPGIAGQPLHHTLTNSFGRITLFSRDSPERVTIDTGIVATTAESSHHFSGLAIVEIKQEKYSLHTPATQWLRAMRIQEQPFSKYAIGAALLYPSLKRNNFKLTILKHCNNAT